jgi:hypothetical protein
VSVSSDREILIVLASLSNGWRSKLKPLEVGMRFTFRKRAKIATLRGTAGGEKFFDAHFFDAWKSCLLSPTDSVTQLRQSP